MQAAPDAGLNFIIGCVRKLFFAEILKF
jgi:hypothetical protein